MTGAAQQGPVRWAPRIHMNKRHQIYPYEVSDPLGMNIITPNTVLRVRRIISLILSEEHNILGVELYSPDTI